MSKGTTAIIVIAVVAVLAALGSWWYWAHQSQSPVAKEAPALTTAASESQGAMLPSGKDTSNQSLNQDLSAIDGQMGSFASDNASVNSSLSDQPVQQSSL